MQAILISIVICHAVIVMHVAPIEKILDVSTFPDP